MKASAIRNAIESSMRFLYKYALVVISAGTPQAYQLLTGLGCSLKGFVVHSCPLMVMISSKLLSPLYCAIIANPRRVVIVVRLPNSCVNLSVGLNCPKDANPCIPRQKIVMRRRKVGLLIIRRSPWFSDRFPVEVSERRFYRKDFMGLKDGT